jgi:hypothetical protein
VRREIIWTLKVERVVDGGMNADDALGHPRDLRRNDQGPASMPSVKRLNGQQRATRVDWAGSVREGYRFRRVARS